MNTWEQINEALQEQTLIHIKLGPRSAVVVQEALNNWADGVIAEASPWEVLSVMNEWGWPWGKKSSQDPSNLRSPMTGDGQKAVKSLDPKEVEVVRSIVPNAKARQGDSGQIMALPPKEWERIKGEIEGKPDYYDKMLGNEVSAAGLTKKIGDQLQLVMGPNAKSKLNPGPAASKEPDLSGIASDPTAIQHGAEQFGQMPAGAKINQPPTLGTTFKQTEPENALDDFDVDFDQPQEPETFAPAAAAKPKSSRKRSSRARAARPAEVEPTTVQPPESASARRKRVAAQDMAMMGAKSPEDVQKMTRSGKMRAK